MRSGIGPAGALRDLGIGVAADLPGVGDNLIDHPLAAVDLPTTPGFAGPRFQVMLTLRSALAGPGGPPDLHLSPPGRSTTPRARQAGYSASSPGCWRSAPGAVRLRSAGPADPPRIDIAHLRHPEDMTRMIEATRRARRLSRTPPLAGFATGAGLAPGPAISDGDTAGLARSIRERAGSYHHPVGNLRDGPPPRRRRRGRRPRAGPRHRPALGGGRIGDAGHPRRKHQPDRDRIAERIAQGLSAP